MNFLKKLLGGKGLSVIEKMSLDDLERQRTNLVIQQERLTKKVSKLEARKEAVIRQAKSMKSDLEKKQAYQTYRQIDQEAKSYIAQHGMLSKHIQMLGTLIHVKRRETLLKQAGLWKILEKVSPEELESFLMDMKSKQVHGDERMGQILDILGDFEDTYEEDEDPGFAAFMQAVESVPDEVEEEDFEKFKQKADEAVRQASSANED